MLRRLYKLLANEDGATAVEYGLIVSFILLAIVVGVGATGEKTMQMWDDVAAEVQKI